MRRAWFRFPACTGPWGVLRPPPSRYVSRLPLAAFRWSGAGYSRVDYEPPRLRVEPGTPLFDIATGIARSSVISTMLIRRAPARTP